MFWQKSPAERQGSQRMFLLFIVKLVELRDECVCRFLSAVALADDVSNNVLRHLLVEGDVCYVGHLADDRSELLEELLAVVIIQKLLTCDFIEIMGNNSPLACIHGLSLRPL